MKKILLNKISGAIVCALAATALAQAAEHRERYIVSFAEPGLLHYAGGIASLRATAPSATGTRRLAAGSDASRAYSRYLQTQRAAHVAAMAAALGRDVPVTHSYAVTVNGVATELTATEAARVATLDGVEGVRKAGVETVDTYRGPTYIGADAVWNGSAAPLGVGTRGEGIVVGVIDSGAHSTHPSFADDASCGFGATNHKLVSASDCSASSGGICTGPSPEANAENGHGVHVAGTAVGNRLDLSTTPAPLLPAPYASMSGVAPCAQLRSYKVCETDSCDGAAILSGIENAIADEVDVVNFSISGGSSPWTDSDRAFLEAVGADIVVVASAGNTGAVTNPVGNVNHRGPWVASTAAVTHDRNVVGFGTLAVTGPGTPPATLSAVAIQPGSGLDAGAAATGATLRYPTANADGCGDFPPGYFDGTFALIDRGDCSFEEKINHAAAAGATAVLVANNDAEPIYMNVGSAILPAYSLDQPDGAALKAFLGAAGGTDATIGFVPALQRGDALAVFSLRGPTSGDLVNLTKPDFAAPGVNIYAPFDAAGGEYRYLSGTSMASPHAAGAAALLRALHPAWTPSEVRSVLQTTAVPNGYGDDATRPWTPEDVGSGRIDVARAARASLVLDETYARFLAANPSGGTLDLRELNLPALRDVDCTPACVFTRTVTNRGTTPGRWSASFDGSREVFDVTIEPAQFDLAPGESRTLTLTAAPRYGTVMQEIAYGSVALRDATGGSVDQRLSVAIRGEGTFVYLDVDAAATTVHDECAANPGPGNGIVEPGEIVRLRVPVGAQGSTFHNVTAALARPAPAGVHYLVSSAVLGDVTLGQTRAAEFTVQLDAGAACLADFALPLRVTSDTGAYDASVTVHSGLDGFRPHDLPQSIPDGTPDTTTSRIDVPQSATLAGLAARVTVEHGWVGDLTLKLRSPSGTEVMLLDRPGVPATGDFGCGNRNVDVTFADGEADAEGACTASVGDRWPVLRARPVQPLAAFIGENTAGTWQLIATDAAGGYAGRVLRWELVPTPAFTPICTVCAAPAERVFADGFDGNP